MAGWHSRYDYPDMSNFEKLTGRTLHIQDNFWFLVIIFGVVLAKFLLNLIASGEVAFSGITDLINNYIK